MQRRSADAAALVDADRAVRRRAAAGVPVEAREHHLLALHHVGGREELAGLEDDDREARLGRDHRGHGAAGAGADDAEVGAQAERERRRGVEDHVTIQGPAGRRVNSAQSRRLKGLAFFAGGGGLRTALSGAAFSGGFRGAFACVLAVAVGGGAGAAVAVGASAVGVEVAGCGSTAGAGSVAAAGATSGAGGGAPTVAAGAGTGSGPAALAGGAALRPPATRATTITARTSTAAAARMPAMRLLPAWGSVKEPGVVLAAGAVVVGTGAEPPSRARAGAGRRTMPPASSPIAA